MFVFPPAQQSPISQVWSHRRLRYSVVLGGLVYPGYGDCAFVQVVPERLITLPGTE